MNAGIQKGHRPDALRSIHTHNYDHKQCLQTYFSNVYKRYAASSQALSACHFFIFSRMENKEKRLCVDVDYKKSAVVMNHQYLQPGAPSGSMRPNCKILNIAVLRHSMPSVTDSNAQYFKNKPKKENAFKENSW